MVTIKSIYQGINEKNELVYLKALRKYYKNNFKNGNADESFLMWIENNLYKWRKGNHV